MSNPSESKSRSEPEVYYFGCKDRAGHYLIDRSHRSLGHHDANRLNIPRDHDLDGGPMFLPHPEKVGSGALTYLPACDLTVLAWWGNPWDKRGAVNTAVMVRGHHDADAVWAAFEQQFPHVAPKLTRPELIAAVRSEQQPSEYICKCGVRVVPHRCQLAGEF